MTLDAQDIKLAKMRAEYYNSLQGELKGYDCPKCKNRGHILIVDDEGHEYAKQCECIRIRQLQELAERSGLGDVLKKFVFEKYRCDEEWQQTIYNTAKQFVTDDTAHCFFIGGQIGAGKSHICTAIVREFLDKGIDVQFCVWNDVVTTLKQSIMDDRERYNEELERLKTATVLYIDDFFKTNPTTADIDKAFQIINYRYNQARANNNKRYITIISSEKITDDLIDIDEAIASRIIELCNHKYALNLPKDTKKNMRLKI